MKNSRSFFIPKITIRKEGIIISEGIIKPDTKKLEKQRREREKTESDLEEALREKEQIEHQIRRVGNRIDHLKKGERDRRTHRLCVKGGVIESLIPGLKDKEIIVHEEVDGPGNRYHTERKISVEIHFNLKPTPELIKIQ